MPCKSLNDYLSQNYRDRQTVSCISTVLTQLESRIAFSKATPQQLDVLLQPIYDVVAPQGDPILKGMSANHLTFGGAIRKYLNGTLEYCYMDSMINRTLQSTFGDLSHVLHPHVTLIHNAPKCQYFSSSITLISELPEIIRAIANLHYPYDQTRAAISYLLWSSAHDQSFGDGIAALGQYFPIEQCEENVKNFLDGITFYSMTPEIAKSSVHEFIRKLCPVTFNDSVLVWSFQKNLDQRLDKYRLPDELKDALIRFVFSDLSTVCDSKKYSFFVQRHFESILPRTFNHVREYAQRKDVNLYYHDPEMFVTDQSKKQRRMDCLAKLLCRSADPCVAVVLDVGVFGPEKKLIVTTNPDVQVRKKRLGIGQSNDALQKIYMADQLAAQTQQSDITQRLSLITECLNTVVMDRSGQERVIVKGAIDAIKQCGGLVEIRSQEQLQSGQSNEECFYNKLLRFALDIKNRSGTFSDDEVQFLLSKDPDKVSFHYAFEMSHECKQIHAEILMIEVVSRLMGKGWRNKSGARIPMGISKLCCNACHQQMQNQEIFTWRGGHGQNFGRVRMISPYGMFQMSPSCQSNGLGSGHASPEEMSCLADGIAIGSPLPLGIYHSKDESISPDDIASSMDATDGSLKSSDSDSGRDSAIDDLPRASGLSMDGLASDTLRSSCCNLLGSYCNHSDRDSAISESPLSIGITMSGVQSRSSMQLDAASPDCNQSPCAEPISMTKDLISALPHVVVSPKKIKSPERQNKRKISADLFPPAHNIIGNSTVFRRKLDFSSVQLNQPPKKASQVNAVVFWQAQPRREDSGPRTLMCCAQNTNSPCQSPTMLSEDNMMQQATTSRSLSS